MKSSLLPFIQSIDESVVALLDNRAFIRKKLDDLGFTDVPVLNKPTNADEITKELKKF